jgi:hypothetical protein
MEKVQTVEKTKKRFELPKDDMSFRKIYRNLIESETLTTVFRPNKRLCLDFKGYCQRAIVNARVIDELGLDRAYFKPEFLDEPPKKIKIEKIEVKKIGDLSPADFIGSSPDVHDKQSLIYHLGLIYNLDLFSLTDEALITRIHFSFIH